jgi:glycosyltransferase involved in cell wall biosynthesis
MTRILVWHWGRRGAGPRYAAELAAALNGLPGVAADLSLSAQAEILCAAVPPDCLLPFPTYRGPAQAVLRLFTLPADLFRLARRLRALRHDLAICAMPAPLDPAMLVVLRAIGLRFAVVVHDAENHPGDRWPGQSLLRRLLARRAAAVIALSRHVAQRLLDLRLVTPARLVRTRHPPMTFGPPPPPPLAHGGLPRLLSFGRLLPYKGLDLLADAVALLPPGGYTLRVAGSGPESAALGRLRAAGARVENRWVPEAEVPDLLAWADVLVLSHTEASQSGVAAAGLAAGRWLVATDVGGLAEQLRHATGAVLAAPDPAALSAALDRVIRHPPPPPRPADPAREWRDAASLLLRDLAQAIGGLAVPPPSRADRSLAQSRVEDVGRESEPADLAT